jgi:heme exporter protein A
VLHIRELSFGFRHRQLFSDLTLRVERGELVHLVGPNGAGKSTCMAVIAGLLAADKGTVEFSVEGHSPVADRRVFLEYLPAEANGLYIKMSARDNLRFWASLRGLHLTDQRLLDALATWGLNHPLLIDRFPVEKYSTGMKRRLALTRLTLSPAPCWLLDEPVYGLDTAAMDVFRQALKAHLDLGGMALVISHDLSALTGLSPRTVRLSGGAQDA